MCQRTEPGLHPVAPYSGPEYVYTGPSPTIPKFNRPDPGQFARPWIALKNLLPSDRTELFKYQILVDHLKFEEARMIADAYLNSPTPFTDMMAVLHDKFDQPHQLALRKIASVLESPDIKQGDISAFQRFALQVQSLVGLLKTLGRDGELELSCGSHIACFLSKFPLSCELSFVGICSAKLAQPLIWLTFQTGSVTKLGATVTIPSRCLRVHMPSQILGRGLWPSSMGLENPRLRLLFLRTVLFHKSNLPK